MQWFDAKDSRQPFQTPTDLLNAMRRFWVDDHALDRAIDLFQATRQGSLRAREFGAAVESLASACVGRDFVDTDLCDVFRRGLNVYVREHVKLQVRMRLRADKPSNFSTLVNIAADRDGMNPLSNNPIPKKASVASLPTSSVAVNTSYRGSSSSSRSPPAQWIERAIEWQSLNPISARSRILVPGF